jgi:hypothetical protein
MRSATKVCGVWFFMALFTLIMLPPASYAEVILNGSKPIDPEKQWVFVTVMVDGQPCKFTHVAPTGVAGQALQDFVSAQEPSYRLDILRDMYPAAPPSAKASLIEMEKWIAEGCRISTGPKSTVTAVRVPWSGTHPLELQIRTAVDAAQNIDELKAVLRSMLDK